MDLGPLFPLLSGALGLVATVTALEFAAKFLNRAGD